MDISAVDWALLAVLLVSVLVGAWRGVVYEVLSVLAWLAAYVLAQWFALAMGKLLPLSGASETVRYVAGFAVVFVSTLIGCTLLITLLKKFVSVVGLRPIDRALGAVFGLVRGVLLLLLVVLVISRTPFQRHEGWQASEGIRWLANVAKIVVPMLPTEVSRYLPD